MRRLLPAALVALGLALGPAAAVASAYVYGSNFGFADVNMAGKPTVPDIAGTKAVRLAACELSSGATSGGGFGAAPSIRPQCMDAGGAPARAPWEPGEEPSWRLTPVHQAGAHPDVSAEFRFNVAPLSAGAFGPDGNVKNIIVKLPVGMVGNPEATAKCSAVGAQSLPPVCPPASQVGTNLLLLHSSVVKRWSPIFNVEPRDTVTAEFFIGMAASITNVPITARGRTNSDYGVDTLALLIPTYLPTMGDAATFWGVPWASEHDRYRSDFAAMFGASNELQETGADPEYRRVYEPDWGPIRPLLTNPTSCSSGSPVLTVEADSWQNPVAAGGPFVSGSAATAPTSGCEKLGFSPSAVLRPTTPVADSPAGLEVRLSTPQNEEPPASTPDNPDLAHDPDSDSGAPAYWRTDAGLAHAHLKDTRIELPAGTSFNPAAANGLRGCTTAQIGLTGTSPARFNNDEVTCPESSKLGTLEIHSPLLPDPLFGEVYAAPQHDNPFPGSLTSIYLVSQDDERGLSIKLAGKVDLDERTGQISTLFVDNPQLPFESFVLNLKSGPRAPLNTPAVCGDFENSADFVPWSFPDSPLLPTFHDRFPISAMPNGLRCVTEPEDRSFQPGFEAGSTSTDAGASTGFVAAVSREDGHQELSAVSFHMPPGLVARLAGTPYCPDDTLATIAGRTGLEESRQPACDPASRIGKVDTLAGAGPTPLPTGGSLYLAGPHDPDGPGPRPRAPLSVAAVVPAIAGGVPGEPAFDLGNVVVKSGVYVDPITAEVRVASSPLPYIVGGVPLRVRRVSVLIDKPEFMRNPTRCAELAVGAELGGAADPFVSGDDITASASNRFQVGGCRRLGFKPRLSIRLFGKTRRGANQRLRAVLRTRPRDANIARAAVTLPHSAVLDQEHIGTICTRVQFAAGQCPARSVYGQATAFSPLLDAPLRGPVYLRASDNPLPDLVASLHGQVDVELAGRIDSVKGAIRTRFLAVPDAPVSKFVLNMYGGRRSLIVNSENLCKADDLARARLRAHSARRLDMRIEVGNDCRRRKDGAKQPRRGR